jgi:hypothetical protein
MSRFHDHFSGGAAGYARFRPRYPAALFTYLASLAPRTVRWPLSLRVGRVPA